MNVINKNINEIKPYERNPRNNDEAVKYHIYAIINKINNKKHGRKTAGGYKWEWV